VNESIGAPDSDTPYGDMFDGGLSTYRTVGPEEYESALKTGMVVLDTNSLLDLYRYHESTREEFLRVFAALGNHLWIPHHVMAEFLERRIDVLEERSNYGETTIFDLQALIKKYVERVAQWVNRTGLESNISKEAADTLDQASLRIEQIILASSVDDSLEGAGDIAQDPVVIALEPILRQRVGKQLPFSELMQAKEEARARIRDKRPPGYMDTNKKGGNIEGDYLIWYETLREASRRHVDVLFVTGDVKKDWWRIEKGQAKGPHQDLVAELEAQVGTRLYMLRPPSLLKHASDLLLPIKVSEESVRDARRVSSRAFIAWDVRMRSFDLRQEALILVKKLEVLERTQPGTAVSVVLTPPVTALINALDSQSDTLLLDLTWKVIYASSILATNEQRTPGEEEIFSTIRTLSAVAINVWLNDKADEFINNPPDLPELFDFGELPPYVVIANVHPIIWDDDGVGQYEFSVALSDGKTYEVTRVVPPTRTP
jgi:PIN like domain